MVMFYHDWAKSCLILLSECGPLLSVSRNFGSIVWGAFLSYFFKPAFHFATTVSGGYAAHEPFTWGQLPRSY
jgi:hypothetical protein